MEFWSRRNCASGRHVLEEVGVAICGAAENVGAAVVSHAGDCVIPGLSGVAAERAGAHERDTIKIGIGSESGHDIVQVLLSSLAGPEIGFVKWRDGSDCEVLGIDVALRCLEYLHPLSHCSLAAT